MQIFHCDCGATLFFENDGCLRCNRELGYLPGAQLLSALEPEGRPDHYRALASGGEVHRKCQNYARENVCNWMVAERDPIAFCLACRLNETIPNLSDPKNRTNWGRIEAAKRRLIYSVLRLGLPLESKAENAARGLAFAFLKSGESPEAAGGVTTGHAEGLITIDVAEADEVEREQTRRQMGEAYRTLLGHFRHESGHYYWDRLVKGSRWHAPFRTLFGDESRGYDDALKAYYANGGPPNWQERYISVYASSHPWEDWAETWAHYLHIIDTIETAHALGVAADDAANDLIDRELFGSRTGGASKRWSANAAELGKLLREWVWLSLAMNSINRSMGMRDAYPFVLNEGVVQKLGLVHDVVTDAARLSDRRRAGGQAAGQEARSPGR